MRSQILPAFGCLPLNRIDRLSIQMWVDDLTETLAPRTVRDSYGIFAGILREAVHQQLIRQSLCYLI